MLKSAIHASLMQGGRLAGSREVRGSSPRSAESGGDDIVGEVLRTKEDDLGADDITLR